MGYYQKWRATTADLKELCRKFNMSVSDAGEVEYPCGKNQGEPLSKCNDYNLRWLSTRRATMRNKPEFRLAVKAARILRAYRESQNHVDRDAEFGQIEDNAKHASVKCEDCGRVMSIKRKYLDHRTAPRCVDCGGMLTSDSVPLDEYITTREAAFLFGISPPTWIQAIKRGEVVAQKRGRSWHMSKASCERLATKVRNKGELRKLGLEEQVAKAHVCPQCGRQYRNYNALSLHMRDSHPLRQIDSA